MFGSPPLPLEPWDQILFLSSTLSDYSKKPTILTIAIVIVTQPSDNVMENN